MFKRLMYNKVVEVLNLTTQKITSNGKEQSLLFKGGYLITLLPSGIPYVRLQTDPTTKFSYETMEFIPVSEELSQETPSVNRSDRSDYVFRYSIMFRADYETQVEDALDEFRDYFYTNKQFTLDGYTVSVKTTRGDKNPNIGIDGGWYYIFYQFTIYATAVKNGYIKKDTDTFKIALAEDFDVATSAASLTVGAYYEITTLGDTDWNLVFGTTGVTYELGSKGYVAATQALTTGEAALTYEDISIIENTITTQGDPIFSSATGVSKGAIKTVTLNNRLQIMYDSNSYISRILYDRCMNKLDKDTRFRVLETFDGKDYSYTQCLITNASRALIDGGVVIMLIDWIEED